MKKLFKGGPQRIALVVVIAIMVQACGASNFATDLRLALAVSAPFIESLNLGGRKAAIVADFTELGTDAATMSDSINACHGGKPCELAAVQVFETAFEGVANRDFNNVPKLQTVESLVRGILSAARVYYGGTIPHGGTHPTATMTPAQAQADIKVKIQQLKALTHQ